MRAQGFSLIEMLVAVAVSMIAVAAGVVLMVGTHRSFQSGTDDRAMQETGRVALGELRASLETAGYGLEPNLAIDTGLAATTIQWTLPESVRSQARFGGYPAHDGTTACAGTCRDRVDGSDELVFYSRDPDWSREVTNGLITATSFTLAATSNGTKLEAGQVLQLMCYGMNEAWTWAFVTVSSVSGGSAGSPGTPAVVSYLPSSSTNPYEFPNQGSLLTGGCFTSTTGTIRAFKIDRYQYYVAAIDEAGNEQPVGTAGARPYLMLRRGLKPGGADGAVAAQAVVPDVEDLQVAYVFPLASAQVLGATVGTQVVAKTDGTDDGVFNLRPFPERPVLLQAIPNFSLPSRNGVRTTHHPGNIRAVRIAVTVRSPRADPAVADAKIPAALNRLELTGEAGYRRMVFETSVYLRNLEAQQPVFPVYDSKYVFSGG